MLIVDARYWIDWVTKHCNFVCLYTNKLKKKKKQRQTLCAPFLIGGLRRRGWRTLTLDLPCKVELAWVLPRKVELAWVLPRQKLHWVEWPGLPEDGSEAERTF